MASLYWIYGWMSLTPSLCRSISDLPHTQTYTTTPPPATITMAPFGAVLWKMTGGFYQGLLNPVKADIRSYRGMLLTTHTPAPLLHDLIWSLEL